MHACSDGLKYAWHILIGSYRCVLSANILHYVTAIVATIGSSKQSSILMSVS